MADMIKFYKGLEASLPAAGTNGALYITTDEGAIYLGTGTGMKRLGDFVQVANVASLPAKAHESCLYYCVAENILAKWNGTEWKQINKQPTAEEMKTLLGLGSMAYKSEVAEDNLSAALKEKVNAAAEGNHSHANKTVLDGITAEKVTAWDAAEKNAKDHADGLNTAMNTRVEALEAIDHEHANKALLDTYTQTEADLADAVAKKHAHTFNETELNKIVEGDVAKWNSAEQNAKDYADDLDEAMDARVKAIEGTSHTHANKELLDTYTQTEANLADAVAKKHAHTFVESELNKIADGDVAKWNAVVADHLTADDKATLENSIKEAKKAGTDANTNIEAYKVTNDARVLAVEEDIAEIVDGTNGILAQAKSYTDGKDSAMNTRVAALEGAKDDYKTADEALEGRVNTKIGTDIAAAEGRVDKKLESYRTSAAQDVIDGAQDAEIAKKVDKVDGKDLIATSEIERLTTLKNYDDTQVKADIAKKADAETMATELGKKVDKVEGYSLVSDAEIARLAEVDNYDDTALAGRVTTAEGKITALETESAKHALKTEVEAEFAKYTTTTAQQAIDAEQDRRLGVIEGDYLKAADIANFETKENVKKVADDLAAYVETNNAAVADRYTKSEADGKFAVKGEDAYDDTNVRGLIAGNTEAITNITKDTTWMDPNFAFVESEFDYLYDTIAVDDEWNKLDAGKTVVGLINDNAAAIDALEEQITGLEGAMHFVGVYEEVPATASSLKVGDIVTPGDTFFIDNDKVANFIDSFLAGNPEPSRTSSNGDKHYTLVNVDRGGWESLLVEVVVTKSGNIFAQCHSKYIYTSNSEYITDEIKSEIVSEIDMTILEIVEGVDFISLGKGDDVLTFNAGDVIVVGDKEYVFDGAEFVEFGSAQDWLLKTEAIATYETKTDAANKLTEAKTHANNLNSAMDERVGALEASKDAYVGADATLKSELMAEINKKQDIIPAETYDAYGAAATAESNAKSYTDAALTWGEF